MGTRNSGEGPKIGWAETRLQQRFLALLCWFLLAAIPLGTVLGWASMTKFLTPLALLSTVGGLWLVVFASYLWNRRGFRRANALLLILLQNALPLMIAILTKMPEAMVATILSMALTVLIASFLTSPWASPVLAGLNAAVLLVLYRAHVEAAAVGEEMAWLVTMTGVVLLALIGGTSWFFASGLQRLLADRDRVARRCERRAGNQAALAALSQAALASNHEEAGDGVARQVVITAAERLDMGGGFLLCGSPAEPEVTLRACIGGEGMIDPDLSVPCSPGSFACQVADSTEPVAIDFDAHDAPQDPWLGALNARRALLVGLPRTATARGLLGVFLRPGASTSDAAEAGDFLQAVATVFSTAETRRVAERKLVESQGRYADLFREAADPIVVFDGGGRIRDVNPAATEVTGYAKEELVGRRFEDLDLLTEQERVRARGLFGESLGAGPGRPAEVSLSRRDGSTKIVETRPRLIRWPDGSTEVFSVLRDVTDRRELERQLRAAQRLDGIGRLAGGMAHEYNNLLTVILANTSTLQQGNLLPSAQGDVELIRNAAEQAAELTRKLLAFGRSQVLQPRVIDLNGIVQDLLQVLNRVIGEDIALTFVPGEELAPIRIDPAQLEHALIRLVAQVKQNMPAGGSLVIETAAVELDASPPGRDEIPAGMYVGLRVSDTGAGMDQEEMARIFEPFLEAASKEVNLEMRLATVHGIVGQSQGYIWVESEVGKGTAFQILLPEANEDREIPEQRSPPRATDGGGPILLVEDDEAVRVAACRSLERGGFEVLGASRGEEALRIAATVDRIALLVTDAVLPGMRGQEVAQRLRDTWPDLAVLLISGYAEEEATGEPDRSWRDGFLAKPFTPEQLVDMVRALHGSDRSAAELSA